MFLDEGTQRGEIASSVSQQIGIKVPVILSVKVGAASDHNSRELNKLQYSRNSCLSGAVFKSFSWENRGQEIITKWFQ